MSASSTELRKLYVEQGLSTRKIGERYGVAHITIRRWLTKHGIPLRPSGSGLEHQGRPKPDAETLAQMIHDERRTYREVAATYGVDLTAIPQWLDLYGLPRGSRPQLITPDELRRRYTSGESAEQIAQSVGYSKTTILKKLRLLGVDVRSGGWGPGRDLVSAEGCAVRSTYELRVADWYHARGVGFVYEPTLPFGHGNCRSDFLVNGWYVEVWGVHSVPAYAEKKAWKKRGYARHRLPLVELSPHHFARDKHIMERRLQQTLKPL